MNRAADHYDEFYLWQTIKLAGNGSRLLAPRLRQGLDHRVITILFLPEDDVKRALNQLSLMLQQPLTANDNPPVIATMKAIDRNVEGILLAPQRLGRHYPARQLLAEIRHQRGTQLLIQRTGPQIIIGDHILHVGGLIDHPVTR